MCVPAWVYVCHGCRFLRKPEEGVRDSLHPFTILILLLPLSAVGNAQSLSSCGRWFHLLVTYHWGPGSSFNADWLYMVLAWHNPKAIEWCVWCVCVFSPLLFLSLTLSAPYPDPYQGSISGSRHTREEPYHWAALPAFYTPLLIRVQSVLDMRLDSYCFSSFEMRGWSLPGQQRMGPELTDFDVLGWRVVHKYKALLVSQFEYLVW